MSNQSAKEKGVLRRALGTLWAFADTLESGSYGYALDRIEGMEREMVLLKEELRQIRATAHIPSSPSASVNRRNPATMWDMASGGFSQISIGERGRIAFLSGQIAATPGSENLPKDVAGQAKLATASLGAALVELEASAQDIVMMRVYVVNATTEAFQQVLTALRDLLGDAKPSMTTIGVQALYTPGILVEIEMAVQLP
jgi:enamine deaminase RidA (YjgF/YER057c/UK114 family)